MAAKRVVLTLVMNKVRNFYALAAPRGELLRQIDYGGHKKLTINHAWVINALISNSRSPPEERRSRTWPRALVGKSCCG